MSTQFYLARQLLTFTKFNEFKIPWLKLYLITLYYHLLLLFANFIGFLHVKQRIHFKIATLTYRTVQSRSPSYLSSLINFNNLPDLFALPHSIFCTFLLPPRPMVPKLSGSQLHRFGILFHKTWGYYQPLVLLNAFSKHLFSLPSHIIIIIIIIYLLFYFR